MNEPYFTLSRLIEKGIIPHYFAPYLKLTCEECGYKLISNLTLTRIKCLNNECPLHLKYRASAILSYLGIKGISTETCYKLIKQHNMSSHFEVIPHIFEIPPTLELWRIAQLCFIPGLSLEWQTILGGKSKLDLPEHLNIYRTTIERATKYFNVVQFQEKVLSINIAVHGHLDSFGTRDDFTSLCNSLENCLITTILKSSVSKYVDFLVTYQDKDFGCVKIKRSLELNIPIITPEIYLHIIQNLK